MKTVTRPCAQGDVLFIPIKCIPKTSKKIETTLDHYVVAHSETGHHHVLEKSRAEVFKSASDSFIAYIRSFGDAEVKHNRSFDTHESLLLPKGNYEVRRQREYTPQGFREAAD